MLNIPIEHLPGLVAMLTCGLAAIVILISVVVTLIRDCLNDRVTFERKRRNHRSLRAVRR